MYYFRKRLLMSLYGIVVAINAVLIVLSATATLLGSEDGNGIFDKLYRIFYRHFPRVLKSCLRAIAGERGPKALDRSWQYLCYEKNPIVQVFYLILLIAGYLLFVVYGYPYLPNSYCRWEYHRHVGFLLFIACLFVYTKACNGDPGTVTRQNVDGLCNIFPYDNVLFAPGNVCKTCKTIKPARSKHCSICGICVARCDHHCIWINGCVGATNHLWFLLFLFLNSVICLYGTYLGAGIFYSRISEGALLTATFVDNKTGQKYSSSWFIIFQFLMGRHTMLMFVCIVTTVMGIVLLVFTSWHFLSVWKGTTTNESSKWRYLKEDMKFEASKSDNPNVEIEVPRNIYNQGWWKNWKEVVEFGLYGLNTEKNTKRKKND